MGNSSLLDFEVFCCIPDATPTKWRDCVQVVNPFYGFQNFAFIEVFGEIQSLTEKILMFKLVAVKKSQQ